jgi:hypothetical protein
MQGKSRSSDCQINQDKKGMGLTRCALNPDLLFERLMLASYIIKSQQIMLQNSRRLLYCASKSKSVSESVANAVKKEEKAPEESFSIGEFAYTPSINGHLLLDQKALNEEAAKIYEWAQQRKATHYSFIAYPHTSSICEKQ